MTKFVSALDGGWMCDCVGRGGLKDQMKNEFMAERLGHTWCLLPAIDSSSILHVVYLSFCVYK